MSVMAGFDVHRRQITFDALDTETGEVSRGRIDATPAAVGAWVSRFRGRGVRVAVEACTGWLFVCDALVSAGAEPHLAEPVETRAFGVASAGPRPIARTRGGCASCSPMAGCRSPGSRPNTSVNGAHARGCGTR